VPAIAYYITYRWCIGLQRSDRAVLQHGIETGIIKRTPHGAYIEVHQPLGPTPLEYQGAPVPKRMNKLGAAGRPGIGGLLIADPPDQQDALSDATHQAERRALTALREHQQRSGNGSTPTTEPDEV
jgi:ubiquinol-cytochrome c reductase cytochrome b subunit